MELKLSKTEAKQIAIEIQNAVRSCGVDAYIFYSTFDYEICFGHNINWKRVPASKINKAIKPIEKRIGCKIGTCGTSNYRNANAFVLDENQKCLYGGDVGYPEFFELQYEFILRNNPNIM